MNVNKGVKRVFLAIGIKTAEEFLKKQLDAQYQVVGEAIYREAVVNNALQCNPDIIILRETLNGSKDILSIVYELRLQLPDAQIIFIASERRPGDSLLSELVSNGVYDFITGRSVSIPDVIHLMKEPNKFSDVAMYRRKVSLDEKNNELLYEIPTKEVVQTIQQTVYVEKELPILPENYGEEKNTEKPEVVEEKAPEKRKKSKRRFLKNQGKINERKEDVMNKTKEVVEKPKEIKTNIQEVTVPPPLELDFDEEEVLLEEVIAEENTTKKTKTKETTQEFADLLIIEDDALDEEEVVELDESPIPLPQEDFVIIDEDEDEEEEEGEKEEKEEKIPLIKTDTGVEEEERNHSFSDVVLEPLSNVSQESIQFEELEKNTETKKQPTMVEERTSHIYPETLSETESVSSFPTAKKEEKIKNPTVTTPPTTELPISAPAITSFVSNNSLKSANKQKILTFVGGERGVGNTQVAHNVAIALGKEGYKTIFIELREQGSTIEYLYQLTLAKKGLDYALHHLNEGDLARLDQSITRVDEVKKMNKNPLLEPTYKALSPNVDYLFFSPDYVLETEEEFKKIDPSLLKELCMHLLFQSGYQYIVLDVEPDLFHPLTEVALGFGTHVFFTLTQDVCHIGRAVRYVAEVNKRINVTSKLYYIVNKYDAQASLPKKDIEDWLKTKVENTIPHLHREFIDANMKGLPLVSTTKNKQFKKAFDELLAYIQQI